ncbi:MAG TPA: RsmG family class I SAM-dependent methyltransferase [Pyrinomonadaceae bacterium]|nr:RsmG family class I SAM-dependent methyltransferase [Pyrinomonadaceae bacterium]
MREEFIEAVRSNLTAFDLTLADDAVERLADYYQIVQQHNPILHLVAPCSVEEFAVRHILESLTLLAFLPQNARFADIGTGAGLPSIPCLIVRHDLSAVLIESKAKKAAYLIAAVAQLDIAERATIVNRQFEEVVTTDFSIVTCRALDKFSEKLPRVLKWAGRRRMLFFGGNALGEALKKAKVKFDRRLMPLSEQRYLFVTDR